MAILVLKDKKWHWDRQRHQQNFYVTISEHLLVHRIFNFCAPYFGTSSDVDIEDILEVLWPDSNAKQCTGRQKSCTATSKWKWRSIYFLLEDQKLGRQDRGLNVCSSSTVYANRNIRNLYKGPITAQTTFCTTFIFLQLFPLKSCNSPGDFGISVTN